MNIDILGAKDTEWGYEAQEVRGLAISCWHVNELLAFGEEVPGS
jgi:hypothetical protein